MVHTLPCPVLPGNKGKRTWVFLTAQRVDYTASPPSISYQTNRTNSGKTNKKKVSFYLFFSCFGHDDDSLLPPTVHTELSNLRNNKTTRHTLERVILTSIAAKAKANRWETRPQLFSVSLSWWHNFSPQKSSAGALLLCVMCTHCPSFVLHTIIPPFLFSFHYFTVILSFKMCVLFSLEMTTYFLCRAGFFFFSSIRSGGVGPSEIQKRIFIPSKTRRRTGCWELRAL